MKSEGWVRKLQAQQMAHGDKAVSFEAGSQIQERTQQWPACKVAKISDLPSTCEESEDQARRVSAEALELDFCFVRAAWVFSCVRLFLCSWP